MFGAPAGRAPVIGGKRPREPTRPGIATRLGAPSVAPEVAATRRGRGTAGTSRVLRRAPRLITNVGMVVPTRAKMVRPVMRAFPLLSGQRHSGHTLQKLVSNSPLASSRGG